MNVPAVPFAVTGGDDATQVASLSAVAVLVPPAKLPEEPVPVGNPKVTDALGTGKPSESVIFACSNAPNTVLVSVVWGVPPDATIVVGGPATLVSSKVATPTTPHTRALAVQVPALHSYLRVDDVHHAVVQGLAGARYKDKILGRDDVLESASVLAINCAIDRVYRVAPDKLEVQEPGCVTSVRATGFPDTVVWNPWIERGAAIEDLETGDYTHMLCIEAAAARAPVRVEPGRTWIGTQTLVAA